MSTLDEPITRQELYLSYLNGNTDITLPEPITRVERYLYALCVSGGAGGGGEGTSNYNNLLNLPSIEGMTLKGNKKLSDLGIQPDGKTIVQNLDGTMSAVGGGGEGGTTNYSSLNNLPQINGVTLVGNKSLHDIGVQPEGNYLTEIPESYVTEEELNSKGYLANIPSYYVTNSEMEEYAQPKGDYASVSEIPTKTSDLDNDSGYLTSDDVISTDKILKTTEELESNTEEGYIADALVVKEINDSLNRNTFGASQTIANNIMRDYYVFPTDGNLQIYLDGDASGFITVSLLGADNSHAGSIRLLGGQQAPYYLFPVKKGMKVCITALNGSCILSFFPFS